MQAPSRAQPDEDDDAEAQQAERAQEAWERAYEEDRSWEGLEEDEQGRLRAADPAGEQRAKRARTLAAASCARIRRGMIRYLLLVVDLSDAALEADLRPSRLGLLSLLLPSFVREFFSANPLGQLSVAACRRGRCERLTELGGSPEAHAAALARELAQPGAAGGALSLQNALEAGTAALAGCPPYGARELLLVQCALSSCDPGSVHAALAAAKGARVRVSVVALSAEVFLSRRCAQDTGGTHAVARSEAHLEALLMAHVPPPPSAAAAAGSTAGAAAAPASLVRMGFPVRGPPLPAGALAPGHHPEGLYVCPRCGARASELPAACGVCRLTLVSSPHLARSYHHLFPVAPLEEEVPPGPPGACYGCGLRVGAGARGVSVRCPECGHRYCFACDSHIHAALHVCPGCLNAGVV